MKKEDITKDTDLMEAQYGTKKNAELLHTQMNVEFLDNLDSGEETGSRLVSIEPVEKTPFAIITLANPAIEGKDTFIVCGDSRMTELGSYAHQRNRLEKDLDWELIVGVASLIAQRVYDEKVRESKDKD